MPLLVKSLGVIVGMILMAFGIGFLLPSAVHVERTVTINAPPEEVFALVSDLNQWNAWSPWANIDPNAEFSIAGSGVGQSMSWKSDNPQVGQGQQIITSLTSPSRLQTHLEFVDQGFADATFNLSPDGEATDVTWALDTDMRAGLPWFRQPISTYMGFLMDKLVGQDYETGLQNLKTVVER